MPKRKQKKRVVKRKVKRKVTRKVKRKMLHVRGIFDKMKHWAVKNAISLTPFPIIQKAIKPRVLNKKTGKWEKVNLIPRGVWIEAGVPDKALDKWKYLKSYINTLLRSS